MKAIKTLVRFLVGVMLCLSVVISLIFIPLRGVVFSEDYLTEKLTGGYLDAKVVETVRENIAKSTELYLPCGDTFNRSVEDEEIIAYAHSSIRNIVRHFVYDEDIPKPEFESENLYNALVSEMGAYAEENDLELQDDAIDEIYEALCYGVRKQLMFYGIGIFNQIPSYANYKSVIYFGYAFIGIAVVCFVVLIWKNGKSIWNRLYNAFTAVWLGTAVGFIPLIMLKLYNIPERSAFSYTPQMKELIRNIHDLFVDRLLLSFGVGFIVSTVLVIIAIVGVVIHRGRQDNKAEIEE